MIDNELHSFVFMIKSIMWVSASENCLIRFELKKIGSVKKHPPAISSFKD